MFESRHGVPSLTDSARLAGFLSDSFESPLAVVLLHITNTANLMPN